MNGLDPFEVWRDVRALVIDGLDAYRRHAVEVIGLPFSRIRAVRRLVNGPLTHAELAEAMMVDRPAATVAVDDLCARGLVVRAAHPTDRRQKFVLLTEQGRLLAERINTLVPPRRPVGTTCRPRSSPCWPRWPTASAEPERPADTARAGAGRHHRTQSLVG